MMDTDYSEMFWVVDNDMSEGEARIWAQNITQLHPQQPHKHGPFTQANLNQAVRDHGNLLCPGCGRYVTP